MEDLSVTILGSSSAIPIGHRSPTAQFLTIANRHFLLDCGEGTQVKLRRNNIGFGRINHIFISHMHGDHFYGLVPLLSSLHLLDRRKEMHLYGPPELEPFVYSTLKVSKSKLRFPLIFHTLKGGEVKRVYEDEAITVDAFPQDHSTACHGFRFQEKTRPRNMRKEALEKYRIPVAEIRQIKKGADWVTENGETIANEELTTPGARPCSYAFCTDTAPVLDNIPHLQEVDLLYHEATFMDEHSARASETRHSTAKEAATMAHKAGAKHLLLGHFSVRYRDLSGLLDEAQSIFDDSHLALEDHTYTLHRASGTLQFSTPTVA